MYPVGLGANLVLVSLLIFQISLFNRRSKACVDFFPAFKKLT
jgi:hypothetical protein